MDTSGNEHMEMSIVRGALVMHGYMDRSFTNAKDMKAIQAVRYLHNIPKHIRRQNSSTNHCIIE